MIEGINNVQDLKKLNLEQLNILKDEIREILLNKILVTGGHLAPNLGVVELTIALHYVFNSPEDKIIFDVSHQSYVHKILTGRKEGFINKELWGSLSGFTTPKESKHDLFKVGHTSTSISLGLGVCKARDLNNDNYNVISIIGDGSLSGGEAYEGLNNASLLKSNYIIIVNDNEMSISTNVGGLYKNLEELRNSNGKASLNFFKTLGFDYLYIEEGNNLEVLINNFNKIKNIDHPLIVHVHTLKGKGYDLAELDKEKYHYATILRNNNETYQEITNKYLLKKIKEDEKLVVVNAATPIACGISKEFRETAKDRYVDVGICEEHAIAYISGMAKFGGHPLFLVMSNFLQRTYDQLNQDLAMNNSPATIVIFNGGIIGGDCTHVGMYDIGMMNNIPNLVMLAPTNKDEYFEMLEYSLSQNEHPIIIRAPLEVINKKHPYKFNKDELFNNKINYIGEDVAIFALGSFYNLGEEVHSLLKEKGINATLINPRIYSTLDTQLINELIKTHKIFVTLENGVINGGYGETLGSYVSKFNKVVLNYGAKKDYNDLISKDKIFKMNRLEKELIVDDVLSSLKSLDF